MTIHPAVAPISRLKFTAPGSPEGQESGGQTLAALGTATGQNLPAVGSSHSLTETVNLGTMTTAGLIGTLHKYTSCQKINMLDSRMAAATHNNGFYNHARIL